MQPIELWADRSLLQRGEDDSPGIAIPIIGRRYMCLDCWEGNGLRAGRQ